MLPILYGLVRGLLRGLARELTTILAVVCGFIVAKIFAAPFAAFLLTSISLPERAAMALAYILLFAGVALGMHFAAKLLTTFLKKIELNGINRCLGGLFGAIKWAILVSAILNLLLILDPYVCIIKPEAKQASFSYKPTLRIASVAWDKASAYLPSVPQLENQSQQDNQQTNQDD